MSDFAPETASPEPPIEGAEAPEPTEPAAPAFDYEAPEFLEAVERVADSRAEARLVNLLEQAAQYQETEGDEDTEIDPYGDPAGLRQMMRQLAREEAQQVVSPMAPTVQAFEDQQNEQLISEWCEHIPAIKEAQDLLPEDHKDDAAGAAVRMMATGYLPDLEARYGPGERAVQSALRMAADQYKADIDAAYKAGWQANVGHLNNLTGAPSPTPSAVESVGIRDEPADEMAAAALWASRNGLR